MTKIYGKNTINYNTFLQNYEGKNIMANISKIGEKAKISTQVQFQMKKNNY